MVISGKLVKGVTIKEAEAGIDSELEKICTGTIKPSELEKVINKVESTMEFSEMDLADRALNLAIAEYMGDVNLVNTEMEQYKAVTGNDIQEQARKIFRDSNCSVLYYLSKNRSN